MRKLAAETELELCQRYRRGESAMKLAPEYGVSISLISHILRRNGFEPRSASEARRQYQCNHNFFNSIDTESEAYWLGFIAADGYITHPARGNNPELRLSLATLDKDHIHKFRHCLKSTHPVHEYDYSATSATSKPYATLMIRSSQLVADLAKFGIVSAKTHTLQWPQLSIELQRHFLRGYVDGDGGFALPRHYKNRKRVSTNSVGVCFRLTSNEQFLLECQRYLMGQCQLNRTKLAYRQDKWKGTVPALIYNGRNQCRRIFNLMYDEATVFLPRKHDKVAAHLL